MKKVILTSILFLSICINNLGQSSTIEGSIKEIDSVSVLPGVQVYLDKTRFGAVSNGNGNFTINHIPKGKYTLIASAIGYLTIKKEVTIADGQSLKLDFIMKESVSVLSEVTIMTGGSSGLKDVPGSVYYISPKEIQKFSYTDINRTLRAVPGVNMQEEDGFGLRPNIGLRGTGVERSSKITVMEDGVLMAPAPYAAPAAYYFPTIGRMQAIEILKGSSQIKYGPYTTGGAINLISTRIPQEFSGKVDLIGGSFGGRNLHAYVGNSHKNVAYMVETYQYSSDGFKQLDGGGTTGFDKKDYLAKIRLKTSDSAKIYQSVTLKLGQTSEISNETYLGLTQSDFGANPIRRYAGSQVDKMTAEQSQMSVTHLIRLSKSFNITTTAYRTDFKRNWFKLDKVRDSTGQKSKIGTILDNPTMYGSAYDIITGTSSTNSDALFVKANNRRYYAQGVQTVLNFNFKTNKISHDFDLGFRVHQDQIDRFQWVDEYAMDNGVMELTNSGKPGSESNRVETANAVAAYLQYKLKIKKLTITPGLRYENIFQKRLDYGKNDSERTGSSLSKRSNTVDVFIPGISVDYKFNKFTSTFAGVHKGFAPPGSKAGVKPENSVNYEWGARYSKKSLSGELVLFVNDYSNLLGTDLSAIGGSGTIDLFNGGEVLTKGIEFQISYDLLASKEKSRFLLPLSIVYTYTDAKFLNSFDSSFEGWGEVQAGDQFPYMANNQIAVILGLEHRKFSVNISGKYLDKMRTLPGEGAISESEIINAYTVIDMSANYKMHKNVSLFATATNITDAVYVVAKRPAGLRPGLPRAFNLGLKAVF